MAKHAALTAKERLMGSIFEPADGEIQLTNGNADLGDSDIGLGDGGVDLSEAARQLQQAAHDAQVAFDCIGLNELDRAHTHALTARAAADAAENALRMALGGARTAAH
jgi:hypothetical protein